LSSSTLTLQGGPDRRETADLTKGELVKSIDKLTGSDFFPDVIGVKEHFRLAILPTPHGGAAGDQITARDHRCRGL
jgi:hypothetical protein